MTEADITAIRQELEELKEGEEKGMIRLPPETRTAKGRNVSNHWAFGSLVPPKFIRYHDHHKKHLEQQLQSAKGSTIPGA